jgi:lipopolysaccharide/colanic/teichoic acid biosynthesis glycosyltransferase
VELPLFPSIARGDFDAPTPAADFRARKSARLRAVLSRLATETLNRVGASLLLVALIPLSLALAIAIRIDSPGPVLVRLRRVGRHGREFAMWKFRKMRADAAGPALTSPDDDRFTRLGSFLAKYKLDEVPQLWNVLCGHMSLVGPRPEDPGFVELQKRAYIKICKVKPGITGLSQLTFARESEILDPENRVADYVERVLPQKIRLDQLYAERRSVGMDLRILLGTFFVTVFRGEIAVHRGSGRLTVRRRPPPAATVDATEVVRG